MNTGPAKFQALLDKPGMVIAPGVFDAISAKLAEDLGFEAVYVGSYASAATLLGLPDTGFVDRSQMLDQLRRITGAIELPVIIDGEGGFGNPVHVYHTVRELERAGAAGTHIEDHEFGKHITPAPMVLPIEAAADKLRAAVDAKTDPNFKIIGRTDSKGALGLEGAIERAVRFAEVGADMVFIAGLTVEEAPRVREVVSVPILNTDSPGGSTAAMEAAGIKVAIYFALSHFAAYNGVRRALETLKRDGELGDSGWQPESMQEFDRFLGVPGVAEQAQLYNVVKPE